MATRGWSDRWDEIADDPNPDPLDVIRAAAMYQRYFMAAQDHAVQLAREQGHTWEDIGAAAGTTRQAAWQRFNNPEPAATTVRVKRASKQPITGKRYFIRHIRPYDFDPAPERIWRIELPRPE